MHTDQRTNRRLAHKSLLICSIAAIAWTTAAQIGAVGTRTVTLAWDPSPTLGVSYKLLQREVGSTNWTVAVMTTNTMATVTIPKATNYAWTVVAFNIWGDSVPSNEVESQYPPGGAGNLRPVSTTTTTTTTVTEIMP